MGRTLTVADFFAGAGGWTEGFRQQGFDVVFALDIWKPAVDTHELNHPDCKAIQMDILKLDTPAKIDAVVPDTDVVVGSPPCIAFSGSNRAGKADKTLGVQLIEAYLRIVAWKRSKGYAKYWVLENVPNSAKHIKDRYTWAELGLPGKGKDLIIKERAVLNAAEFGAPQSRRRFFGGEYVIPEPTNLEGKQVTIAKVAEALGNPLSPIPKVRDPVYGFTLDAKKLTDHFYDSRVPEFEWEKAQRLKEDHGYMGRMSFPEDTARPSRTVMATMSSSTREAIILQAIDKNGRKVGYRTPSIREVACFMSFPITYQFQAGSETSKYRLVGNAVCPKLISAIAAGIRKAEGLDPITTFPPLRSGKPFFDLTGGVRVQRQPQERREDARFALHVPGLKIRGFRVELSNKFSDFVRGRIVWRSILHYGSGKGARGFLVPTNQVRERLITTPAGKRFSNAIEKWADGLQVSPEGLQESYRQRGNHKHIEPQRALQEIRDLVNTHFPDAQFAASTTESNGVIERDGIPTKVLATLLALNVFVEHVNSRAIERRQEINLAILEA